MDNNLYKVYDGLSNVAIVNLYSSSKDKEKIVLHNFNFTNKAHLCLLKIAESLRSFTGFQIYIKVKGFNRIWLFFYNRKKRTKIRASKENGVDTHQLLMDICKANYLLDYLIFNDIYKEYYKKKVKEEKK